MIWLMVGRDLSSFYDGQPRPLGEPMLEVVDLVVPGRSIIRSAFSARRRNRRRGGAGRRRPHGIAARAVRSRPARGGHDPRRWQAVAIRIPSTPSAPGWPWCRKTEAQGLMLEMSVRENIGLAGGASNTSLTK